MTAEPAFRPMHEEEFRAWRKRFVEDNASDAVRNLGVPVERSRERSREDIAHLLPDGLVTEGHRFLVAEDPSSGERLGHLWMGPDWRREPDVLWLYDVFVEDAHRGRGVGRAMMLRLESEARAMGRRKIGLNVFGHNEVARDLYESLGYSEAARQMYKELD